MIVWLVIEVSSCLQMEIPEEEEKQKRDIKIVLSDNQYKIKGVLTEVCIAKFLEKYPDVSVHRLRGCLVSLSNFKV